MAKIEAADVLVSIVPSMEVLFGLSTSDKINHIFQTL